MQSYENDGSITSHITYVCTRCFALVQNSQAVNPPPDGGYPDGNTAEGTAALLSLGPNGFNNTAIGFLSLKNTTQGNTNTAVGAGALFSNRGQGQNTATGAGALFNSNGENNTANGAFALYTNSIGSGNTAVGITALYNNTVTYTNTAIGYGALFNNGGDFGTAGGNTAIGFEALYNNTTGNSNIAVGSNAGFAVTTSSNVLCIGTQGANVDDSCYIANIWQQPSGPQQVFVNADGKLGAQVSSRRFKDEIKPMEQSSEVIYKLRPVSFRYKPVMIRVGRLVRAHCRGCGRGGFRFGAARQGRKTLHGSLRCRERDVAQ